MSFDKQPKKRMPTVAIEPELYRKLREKAGEKRTELIRYVNDVLAASIEKDEFLKMYAPNLSRRDIIGNCLIVWDDMKRRAAEVWLREGNLYCELCKQDDCMHVHFALAIPEVGKLTNIHPSSVLPLLIKDGKTGKVAKVDYNQLKLYCHLCQSNDCVHVDIAAMEVDKETR